MTSKDLESTPEPELADRNAPETGEPPAVPPAPADDPAIPPSVSSLPPVPPPDPAPSPVPAPAIDSAPDEPPEHIEYYGEEEWVAPRPVAERVRHAWWKRLLGLPAPRKYSLAEIRRHVWHEHILWPQAWFHLLLFALLTFAFWMNAMNYWVAIIDDAYITIRYSDHLIRGHGFVYSLGERVEGFTNFTWMVMLAVVIGLKGDPMFWAKTLGFLCCLGAMVGVAYFGGLFSRRRDPWNWLAVVPLAANAHFAHWSMMGLETQLQVVLVVWTFARFYKEMRDPRAWNLSPLLASLAAMTRIESLYYLTPLAAYALIQVSRGRLDWRRFFRWGLWCALIFVPYFVWKYTYFGDIAPNTYYAKKVYWDNHGRGIAHLVYWYLGQGNAFRNLWLIPLLMALLWARPVTVLILGPLILNVYYVYHVDGDWMPNLRFLQIAAPFLGLLLLLGVRWVQRTLHDWRGEPAAPAEGRNGVLWLLAEIAIFGSWIWLVFFKARELWQYKGADPFLLWKICLAGVIALLFMRWMSGWNETRRATRRVPAASCPVGPLPLRSLRGSLPCVGWMGLEWIAFIAFGGLVVFFSSHIAEFLTLVRHDLHITFFDFGLWSSAPPDTATVPAVSRYTLFYIVVAALGIGWLIRLVSKGRFARSLVRWPLYAGLLLLVAFYTHFQLAIGSVYIFDKTPSPYPRAADSLRWRNVRKAVYSGFSPPLQNVADWILDNCQSNTTIYMSDIGYPLWLNPTISLIDVDGLTNKVIADAPSVRGKYPPAEDFIAKSIAEWKLRQELPPEEMKAIAEETKKLVAEQAKALAPAKAVNPAATPAPTPPATPVAAPPANSPKPAAGPAAEPRKLKTPEQIQAELVEKAKLSRDLPDDLFKRARSEGVGKYFAARWSRAGRYVIQREPEYMNIFMSHSKQNDPKSNGWVYPDISRAVADTQQFKDNYIEVGAQNKYMSSWNHYYRRKDVKEGISPEERIARLQLGIRRNPRMSYLYLQLANALIDAGKPYEGEPKRILHASVETFQGNDQYLNQLAQWGRTHKDEELSILAWRKSLESNPNQDWLYRQIAEYYIANDRLEDALDIGRRAVANTGKGDVYLLGILTRIVDKAKDRKDKDKLVEEIWRLVVESKPDQEWLYRRAADYYVGEKRFDDAVAAARVGLDHCQGTGIHLHLAYLLEQAGRPDEGVEVLRKALVKENRNARVCLDLGALLGRLNRLDEALEVYQKAIAIDPNNPMARNSILDLEKRLGRPSTLPPAPSPSAPPQPAHPTPVPTPAAAHAANRPPAGNRAPAAEMKPDSAAADKQASTNEAEKPVPASANKPASTSEAKSAPSVAAQATAPGATPTTAPGGVTPTTAPGGTPATAAAAAPAPTSKPAVTPPTTITGALTPRPVKESLRLLPPRPGATSIPRTPITPSTNESPYKSESDYK